MAAVLAAVAAPAVAASPPAYDIYVEQVPTATGSKPTSGVKPAGGHTATGGPTGQQSQAVPLTPKAAATLQHEGGKDRTVLKTVATSKALGASQRMSAPSTPNRKAPSAISAAFNLGSGPTVLFVVLLGVAALLLAIGGGVSRRRRSN